MNKKLVKLLIIPVLIALGHFLLLAFPYFSSKITPTSSLGFSSLVEENAVVTNRIFNERLRKENESKRLLLKNEKLVGNFVAKENNLGIILVRFLRDSDSTDIVVFRIKEKDGKKWYYENKYATNQFQNDQYFTFGFPTISNSQNNKYVFEIESLAGNYSNAIGVSESNPQVALVYKYSRNVLSDYPELSSIIIKKLFYAARNIDYTQIILTFLCSLLVVLLLSRNTYSSKKSLNKLVTKYNGLYKNKLFYISSIEKPLKKIMKSKLVRNIYKYYTSSFYYKYFLNTSFKKRILIVLIIFAIAFIYRVSPVVGAENPAQLYYSALGGQGDYDEMMRVGKCAIIDYHECIGIIIYDFVFLTPLLGLMYLFFGFIGGINVFLYIMIIMSAIVATIPYLLLSRTHWLSVGGIIGSFILATNDFLVTMALGFPIDNSAVFLFAIFTITYYITLMRRTLPWLIFFGVIGFADGLNKVLFFINNLLVFIFFIPIFFYDRVKKITKPYFKKSYRKLAFFAAVPFIVFVLLYTAWELYIPYEFNAKHYFLKQLILERGGGYTYYVTNDSPLMQNIFLLPLYVSVSGVVMVQRLLNYIDLPTIFYGLIFIGLIFTTFTNKKVLTRDRLIFWVTSGLLIALFIVIQSNAYKIHDLFSGDAINAWNFEIYWEIFIFIEIVVLFLINLKYKGIKLLLPIIVYVGMLTLMAKNLPLPRLHTHVLVASILLLAFIIDWMLNKFGELTKQNLRLGQIVLTIFILAYILPVTIALVKNFYIASNHRNEEIKYLSWVNNSLPQNAIILGGGKDDIVLVAQNLDKPIVYNTLYGGAQMIPITRDYKALQIVDLITYLQKKQNFDKNTFIILDMNKETWRNRLMDKGDGIFSSTPGHPNPKNYVIKEYKYNKDLKKGIYELRFAEKLTSGN